MVLGFADYEAPARRLAGAAGLPYAGIEVHHFPDGESLVRLPPAVPAHTIIFRSLDRPHPRLVEVILAAETARKLGAERITLVVPYLAYMRQDKAFHPGEAISQRIVGQMLADVCDALITVDPHLHRVHHLRQAVPATQAVALTATEPMATFLAGHTKRPVLLGPDAESEQWVRDIAVHHGLEYAVGTKKRLGDRNVRYTLPDFDFGGRHVILVDDVASTGQTLVAAASAVFVHRPADVSALVTHALFVGDAEPRVRHVGVGRIWSTDSVGHHTNAIELAPLLAGALARLAP